MDLLILITLGTQDKSFERLLKSIDMLVNDGKINEKIVVQAGHTKFNSDNMEMFDYIPMDKFDELIESCDVLITHGGVGSIIAGMKNNKKVIAAARLKKYKEHTNDHQLEIIEAFEEEGYIINIKDFSKIDKYINDAKEFKPKEYSSNQKEFIIKLDKTIQSLL